MYAIQPHSLMTSACTPDTTPRMQNGKPTTTKTWIILAALMIVGLGLRLSYLSYLKTTPGFTHPELDDLYHDYWARVIAFGHADLPSTVDPPELDNHPYFRPPGYPYFLAAVYNVCGTSPVRIRVIQHLIGVISGFLLFRFVRRWFDESVALVTAGLLLVTWFMVFYEGTLNAPVLLIPLIILIINYLARLTTERTVRSAAMAGICLGLYALVRPEILTFAPVAALWIFWVGCKQDGRRTETVSTYPAEPHLEVGRGVPAAPSLLVAVFAIGAILVIAPATIRNYRASGEPVLISVNGGINFFFGNNSESKGTAASHSSVGAWTCFDYPRLVRDMSAKAGHPVSYSEASSTFFRQGFSFICHQPRQALALTWRKACLFWGPHEIAAENDIETERQQSALLRNLPTRFSVILGLALTGFLMVWPWRRESAMEPGCPQKGVIILILLWIATCSTTTILFFVSSRYRIPILPFLFVGASFALVNLWRLLTTAPTARWLPWVAVTIATQLIASINPYHQTPKPEAWHLNAAISCVQNKQIAEAHQHLDAALTISPKNPEILYRMGSLLRIEGHVDDAIRSFEKAIAIDPQYLMAYIELGSIRAVQNQPEAARQLFEKAVAISPGSAIANLCLGQVILDAGDADKAEPYFKRASDLDSRLHEGDRFLASRAMKRGDFATAEIYCRHWVAASPATAMAHACLAQALAPLHKRDEASAELEEAFRLDPKLKEALTPEKAGTKASHEATTNEGK